VLPVAQEIWEALHPEYRKSKEHKQRNQFSKDSKEKDKDSNTKDKRQETRSNVNRKGLERICITLVIDGTAVEIRIKVGARRRS
jgi:hypothetical protein